MPIELLIEGVSVQLYIDRWDSHAWTLIQDLYPDWCAAIDTPETPEFFVFKVCNALADVLGESIWFWVDHFLAQDGSLEWFEKNRPTHTVLDL